MYSFFNNFFIFLPNIIFAIDKSNKISLGISGGWIISNNTPDSVFGKTSAEFNLSNYLSLELSILNGTSKGGLTFISIDSYLSLLPQKKINPFIIVGGGAGIVDRGGKPSTEGLLSGGAGVQHFLTEDLAIRFEFRSYALTGGESNRS